MAGSMAATIAAVCIAVGLPALLWFSSHFVKRTFHNATGLKWPCGARGRSYRRMVSRPRWIVRRGWLPLARARSAAPRQVQPVRTPMGQNPFDPFLPIQGVAGPGAPPLLHPKMGQNPHTLFTPLSDG